MMLPKISHTKSVAVVPHELRSRGFTLLEVLIVIALFAIVFSMSATFSLGSVSRTYALSERDVFVSLLTQARAKSLANINKQIHSVYVDATNNRYVLYGGPSSSTGAIYVAKSTTLIPLGQKTFTFEQLTGDALSGIGTTTITGGTISYGVHINSAGRINW